MKGNPSERKNRAALGNESRWATVGHVAQQRAPCVRRVHANLVGAPRLRFDGEQRGGSRRCDDSKGGLGRDGVATEGATTPWIAIAADGGGPHGEGRLGDTLAHSNV